MLLMPITFNEIELINDATYRGHHDYVVFDYVVFDYVVFDYVVFDYVVFDCVIQT